MSDDTYNQLHTCAVCNTAFSSFKSLSNHINKAHKIPAQEYYDTYLAKKGDGLCDCGKNKETRFLSVIQGYAKKCGPCARSIGAKRARDRLRADEEKFESFRKKVSNNLTKKWEEREQTGEADIIRAKVAESHKRTIEAMTPEERKDRFGYWNKKSPEEKEQITKKILMTRHNLAQGCVDRWRHNKKSRELYYESVWKCTEISYQWFKRTIDPRGLRGRAENGSGFDLDHNFSIMRGFLKKVDPKLIGHPCNLQMLTSEENKKKSARCWITLDDLLNKIEEFDANTTNSWVAGILYEGKVQTKQS